MGELFKWIKQHLRIKAFFGTSENAVKTQICIAVSRLRAGRDHPQAAQAGGKPLPDSRDCERDAFRENAHLQALQASSSDLELLHSGNQLILFDF